MKVNKSSIQIQFTLWCSRFRFNLISIVCVTFLVPLNVMVVLKLRHSFWIRSIESIELNTLCTNIEKYTANQCKRKMRKQNAKTHSKLWCVYCFVRLQCRRPSGNGVLNIPYQVHKHVNNAELNKCSCGIKFTNEANERAEEEKLTQNKSKLTRKWRETKRQRWCN